MVCFFGGFKSVNVVFKVADSQEEFAQIAELNYSTFVEEIPQHSANSSRSLTDFFHAKNTYIVAKDEGVVIGMLALNMERPFSMDAKIPNLDRYIDASKKILEIRLLAIKPAHRKGRILLGLMRQVVVYALANNVDFILISGTTRELRMYEKFGFESFHPLVGKAGAMYSPMILDTSKAEAQKWKNLTSYPDL